MSAGDVYDIASIGALAGIPAASRRAAEPVAIGIAARPLVARDGIPAAMLREDVIRMSLWQFGLAGSRGERDEPSHFSAALMLAFQRADEANFRLLRDAYPVLGFWMHALRFGTDGHQLALRALTQLGVTL